MADLQPGWIVHNGQAEPSPETITAACREFQATWSPAEEQRRTVPHLDDTAELLASRAVEFPTTTVILD